MNKFFVFLLVAVSLFGSLALSSKAIADKNLSVDFTPTPPVSAEFLRINLDKDEVFIPGPPAWKKYFNGPPCISEDDAWGLIAVETIVRNPKKLPLVYAYTVSGGRIIGKGEKVVWDLKGVRPGTYTIDAAIDYGQGFVDKPKSETVAVIEPDCNPPCICLTVDVSGGGAIKAGETVTFEANISGGEAETYTCNWTVSQGEIIEGQGSRQIKVKTTSEMSGEIKATVEIGGSEFCADCRPTAFETATIIK